jgi:hypothetical protein
MADAPQPEAPEPGLVRMAVTMFEHEIEVGIAEARLLIHQGLARDKDAAEAAIETAAEELRAHHAAATAAAAPTASAPAPTVSASGQATPPADSKAKESTP